MASSPLSLTPSQNWQRHRHRGTIVASNPHLSHFAEALTYTNPTEEKQLEKQLKHLDKKKRSKSVELFLSQRQFFIEKIFDSEHDLRFIKFLQQRSKSVDDVSRVQETEEKEGDQTHARMTQLSVGQEMDLCTPKDFWNTSMAKRMSTGSLSERFFLTSKLPVSGTTANQRLIAHETKRMLRRRSSAGQKVLRRMSKPGYRDNDTFLEFILREEGDMDLETDEEMSHSENKLDASRKKSVSFQREHSLPVRRSSESAQQRRRSVEKKELKRRSSAMARLAHPCIERRKLSNGNVHKRQPLQSQSSYEVHSNLQCKSYAAFDENEEDETIERVSEIQTYPRAGLRLVKSDSDLGHYFRNQSQVGTAEEVEIRKLSVSSGDEQSHFVTKHRKSLRSSSVQEDLIPSTDNCDRALPNIEENPRKQSTQQNNNSTLDKGRNHEMLLLQIAKSLPTHLLSKSEDENQSLSDILGFTDRNSQWLEQERAQSARTPKEDPRFQKLMDSLSHTHL